MTRSPPGFAEENAAPTASAPTRPGTEFGPAEAPERFSPGFVETTSRPPDDLTPIAWNPGRAEEMSPRGTGALAWITAGLLLLVASGVALSMAGFAVDQMARSSLLGGATLIAYAAALGALGWGVALEARSYRRLTIVDRLRSRLQDPRCSTDEARRACEAWLDTVARHLPDRDAADAALSACSTTDEVRAALRRHVLEPLREKAQNLGWRAGVQGGALVAITPSPALDGLVAGVRSLVLIREIATLYGLRPGASVTVSLLRRAALTAVGVSGVDLAAVTVAEHLFSNAPILKHVAGAAPGAGLTARRLYRLGQAVAEACSPLPANATVT